MKRQKQNPEFEQLFQDIFIRFLFCCVVTQQAESKCF